ncbi:MAG: hypothetical protein ABIK09_04870 [Pseudomonadota bacterium]
MTSAQMMMRPGRGTGVEVKALLRRRGRATSRRSNAEIGVGDRPGGIITSAEFIEGDGPLPVGAALVSCPELTEEVP